jgi:hypothetical protein
MKSSISLPFLCIVLLLSCSKSNTSSDRSLSGYTLDRLLSEGGSHYDVAAYLYRNPEFLQNTPRSFRDGGRLSYETSADGCFRVYSMELPGCYPDIENILQYGPSKYEPVLLLDELEDKGRVWEIGMNDSASKKIYLPVSFQHFCCGGEYLSACIRSFSIIYDETGFSIQQEPLFKTKSGKLLDSIEVDWDDDCGERSSNNVFRIALDNPENTREVYIQIIDAATGEALDKAIVYRWDGSFFNYAGIIPKRIENFSE